MLFNNLSSHLYLRGVITLFLLTLCFLTSLVNADALRDRLFTSTENIYQEATEVQAELLAPISFNKALDYYNRARSSFKKNKSVDKIKKDLDLANTHFEKSISATKLSRLTLAAAYKAREDALSVNANKQASDEWSKAESQFLSAAKTMEKGSLSKVKKYSSAAETLYRDAELKAIKSSYLDKTREVIAQAKDLKVKKYAPKTLEKAQQLLASAERELSENRYDTDYPRSLVKQSLYEAKHSIYLAEQVKFIRSGDITLEEYLLQQEEPTRKVAESLDLVAAFDTGLNAPTNAITAKIEKLNEDSYELKQLSIKMTSLEKDYAVLEQRLGIQSERLAQQEKAREKLAMINRIFKKHEALVFMQGNNIIIRAVGLSFDPGSAQIKSSHLNLLSKMQQVVRILKGYGIVVEGHTDSFGGDEANLSLSVDRANAVRDYLSKNSSDFSRDKSEAMGYGETRPIANNETATGRRKNRRIDLVFLPKT